MILRYLSSLKLVLGVFSQHKNCSPSIKKQLHTPFALHKRDARSHLFREVLEKQPLLLIYIAAFNMQIQTPVLLGG